MRNLVLCAALASASVSVAHAGNGTNLTKYVTDTSQGIIVMDIAAARSAKLIGEGFAKALDALPDARARLVELGLDPLKDIDTIVFSFGGVTELSQLKDQGTMTIIVEGRLPKDLSKKMTGSTKSMHGAVETWVKDDSEGAYAGGRLYFSSRIGKLGATLDLVSGKSKASLAASKNGKALREAIKKTNTKHHMWVAVALPDQDRAAAVKVQLPLTSVGLGISLNADLDATLHLHAATAADAVTSLATLDAALPQVKQMMGQIGLGAAGATLALKQDKTNLNGSLKITKDELAKVFAMVLAMSNQEKKSESALPPVEKAVPFAKPTGGLGGKKN